MGLLQRSKCGKEKSVLVKGFRQRHISNHSWTYVGYINRPNEKWVYNIIIKCNYAHDIRWNWGKCVIAFVGFSYCLIYKHRRGKRGEYFACYIENNVSYSHRFCAFLKEIFMSFLCSNAYCDVIQERIMELMLKTWVLILAQTLSTQP